MSSDERPIMDVSRLVAMMRRCRAVLLPFLATPLVSCLREPPDRTPAVQGPLILLVLAAPALSFAIRRRHRGLRISLLVLQVIAYLLYETGVSIQTNIRIDLPLIFGAIGLGAWLAFRSAGTTGGGNVSDPWKDLHRP